MVRKLLERIGCLLSFLHHKGFGFEHAAGHLLIILCLSNSRPSQHGPEVVGLLSNIFDEFGQVGDCFGIDADTAESAVLLGLEALKALCEAEVMCYQTMFKFFSRGYACDVLLEMVTGLLSKVIAA